MGDVNVLPAVAVNVGGVNAHACFVAAVFAGGDAGEKRDVLKSAVVLVDEEKIGPGVVGDGDVRPAIVVEIGDDDAHALGCVFTDARGIADIGERSAEPVVVELYALGLVVSGMALRVRSGAML